MVRIRKTLMGIIQKRIVPDSIVYSDGWKGYNVLDVSDLEDELGFKPKFHDKDMLLRAYKSYEEGF